MVVYSKDDLVPVESWGGCQIKITEVEQHFTKLREAAKKKLKRGGGLNGCFSGRATKLKTFFFAASLTVSGLTSEVWYLFEKCVVFDIIYQQY